MIRPATPLFLEPSAHEDRSGQIELSVVMPCLNEADTLGACIDKAHRAMADLRIAGEVVVADNGSTDGSQQIAFEHGARIIYVRERGYGSALMAGIAAARGIYIVMGDADDSYNFGELPRFLTKLRDGYDLVQGCRLPRGGGTILEGAMPPLHRWLGNPLLTLLARSMFPVPVHDVYCGLRGFSKRAYDELRLRCMGMEFAVEMIVKCSLFKQHVTEVPITLHPDGRKAHGPHLRTFRDGWRTLRFFLMYSPRWLFVMPGLLLLLLGALGYGLALPGVTIGGATFDAHTLLVASLALLLGFQSLLFAAFTKTFAAVEGLMPRDARLESLMHRVSVERGIVAGAAALVMGLGLILTVTLRWRAEGFGPLDYAHTMRWVIPGVTLAALGFQSVLAGFLLSILGMARR